MPRRSWLDVHPDASNDSYLKLDEGDNYVRIISEPVDCYEHWVVVPNTKNPGKMNKRKIVCPGTQVCPVCLMIQNKKDDPRERRQRWVLRIIDRTPNSPVNGTVKTLTVGVQILNGVKALAMMVKKQELPAFKEFDIKILKHPQGSNPTYQVFPLQPVALTPEQQQLFQATYDKVNEEKEATPHTPEEIAQILRGEDTRQQEIEQNDQALHDQDNAGGTPVAQAVVPVVESAAVSPAVAVPAVAPTMMAGGVAMAPASVAVPVPAPVAAPDTVVAPTVVPVVAAAPVATPEVGKAVLTDDAVFGNLGGDSAALPAAAAPLPMEPTTPAAPAAVPSDPKKTPELKI